MLRKSKTIEPEFGGYEDVKAIMGREPPRHPKSILLWEKKGFPPAVMLGKRTKVWPLAEVRAYMANLKAEAMKQAAKRKGGR